MSVAFYPNLGLVLFGSEAAATKAGMSLAYNAEDEDMDCSKSGQLLFRTEDHFSIEPRPVPPLFRRSSRPQFARAQKARQLQA
eukprot:2851697-Prymnesium_polylepis.2